MGCRVLLDLDIFGLRLSQVDFGKISSFFKAVLTFIEEFVSCSAPTSRKLLFFNLHNLN